MNKHERSGRRTETRLQTTTEQPTLQT